MTPLTEHQLLVFWLQLVTLVAVARGLGGLMRRWGQPAVVGELAAGLLLGPSVLGTVAPHVFEFLFPDDPVQHGLLLAVSWIGVAFLLVATGFETDLALLRRLGRSSALVSLGSIVVPLGCSFALGLALPDPFLGADADRTTFALFMAVAMSITALAVGAKILGDLDMMRRNVGQVSLAAAMANDLTGWILLGTLAGIVHEGRLDLLGVASTVAAILLFFAAAVTLGQRVADGLLRRARQVGVGRYQAAMTVTVLVALAAGVVTQLIGVEAVLGAFIAGIVLGRSRYQQPEARHTLETVTAAFFSPVFFATAGLRVDLRLLADDGAWAWALAVIAVAVAAKAAGSFAGARLGRLSGRESVAVAVGLNARGTLEIVVATVGLALGVFTAASYTVVIVLAMTTSIAAPPLLRRLLLRLHAGPEESARLEREAVMHASAIANTRTALLPTRGGTNSILAARLLDMSLQPDTTMTVFTVHGEAEEDAKERAEIAARDVVQHLGERRTERIDRIADDSGGAICAEAALGYGLVGVGMTEDFTGGHAVSPVLRDLLARCTVPMLLVKGGRTLDPHADVLPFHRVMVPAIGTKVGQAAQEIAYTLAERVDAQVDAVHVVSRPDRLPEPDTRPQPVPQPALVDAGASGTLEEAQTLAHKFGRQVNPLTRNGPSVGLELAITAEETGADLLVLGARVRAYSGQPFLGHGIEYLLEHAEQTILVVVFPAQGEA